MKKFGHGKHATNQLWAETGSKKFSAAQTSDNYDINLSLVIKWCSYCFGMV